MIDNRENNHWTVYVHIIPKELSGYDWDKYYVGITSQKVKKRWQRGLGYKRNSPYFWNAVQKYNWDEMFHEIIAEKLTESEAKELEKILILKLKSNNRKYGYNLTLGSEGSFGLIGKKANRHRTIFQYDLLGNYINTYGSIAEATKEITGKENSTSSVIRANINGTKRSAYGFLWSDDINKIPQYWPIKTKTPILLRIRKNKILYFKNISDASNKTGYSKSFIRGVLCGDKKSKYIWEYMNYKDFYQNHYYDYKNQSCFKIR